MEPVTSQHRETSPVSIQIDPAPMAIVGERIVEWRDKAMYVYDAAGKSSSVPVKDITGFAVLPDRSLAVLAGFQLHRVVNDAVTASFLQPADRIAPTATLDAVWTINRAIVGHERFGTGPSASAMIASKTFKLPEGMRQGAATLADGALALAYQGGILRVTPAALTSHAWPGAAHQVGPGPQPDQVWISGNAAALLQLTADAAKPIAQHARHGDETMVHFAARGAHAAAVVAKGSGDEATYALVCWRQAGEAWRVALGTTRARYYVALDEDRVVVLARPAQTFRTFDVASGNPL